MSVLQIAERIRKFPGQGKRPLLVAPFEIIKTGILLVLVSGVLTQLLMMAGDAGQSAGIRHGFALMVSNSLDLISGTTADCSLRSADSFLPLSSASTKRRQEGKLKAFPAMQVIADLTQNIPSRGAHYIRRYRLYGSRTKDKWPDKPHVLRLAPDGCKKKLLDNPAQTKPYPQNAPRSVSAKESRSARVKLIGQVCETDPLECQHCGSQLQVLTVIAEPGEVRKILRHLVKIGRSPPGFDRTSFN